MGESGEEKERELSILAAGLGSQRTRDSNETFPSATKIAPTGFQTMRIKPRWSGPKILNPMLLLWTSEMKYLHLFFFSDSI